MSRRRIPLTEPHLDANDREHLLAAFDSGWISSQGPYLARFEHDFAQFCGTKHALATCNGTAALHLSMLALGLQPGDEVIVPTFTYIATANAVRYCNAKPVLVDCDADTWNIDPAAIEAAITPRTVGIVPVHLYGTPCDMRAIGTIAARHGLWTVEDAAEAHGATIGGRRVGSFGTLSCFSLYGNKIVTTGEGGVVTTDDPALAKRVALFRGQSMDPERRYWFPDVGWNYRMTNLAAALGVAQMSKIDMLIEAHRRIAAAYRAALSDVGGIVWQSGSPDAHGVDWLASVRIQAAENRPELRDELMRRLAEDGIETRPFFYPLHVMPPYFEARAFPCADRISTSGLNLPSSPRMSDADIAHVAARLCFHLFDMLTGDLVGRAASEKIPQRTGLLR
jgi:perosamine synthetase